MNTPGVRRAGIDDAAAILQMEQHFPGDRMSARSVRRFLRSPGACVWIAEVDTATAGSLVLLTRRGGRSARIYSVIVLPQHRGRGLAAQLVVAAEAQARRLALQTVTLEVRADNTAARALYRKLGYCEEKDLPGFYEDGGDGLRLRKALA